jgi:hypothetical protein
VRRLLILTVVLALASFSACQKHQTEEERKAEIEREVQALLAQEHQATQQKELHQREADLDAREKALVEKGPASSQSTPRQSTSPVMPYQEQDETAPHANGSYSTFYTNLDSYGDWIATSAYGYVWRPYEAGRSSNWRPYTIGRWVYSDVGWMWVSDEPFGWAAYHYGRWIRLRDVGWVWVPGDMWAPAWVSWRKNNDYVGWAPLPPEARFDPRSSIRNWADNYYDIGPEHYCFVPTREFGTQRIAPIVVNPEQNVNIVSQTINVTNIVYNNTTVVNYGPDYNDLQKRTQQPIERLRVRRVNVNWETETPRTVVKGEVVEVPAPVISKTESATPPRRLKQTIGKTTAERGWEGVRDPRAAEMLRAKIKAESSPPSDAPPKAFVKPMEVPSESIAPTPVSTITPNTPPTPVLPRPTFPRPAPPATPSMKPETTTTATPVRSPRPALTVIPPTTPSSPRSTLPQVESAPPILQAPRPHPTAMAPPVTSPLPKGSTQESWEKSNPEHKSAARQLEPSRPLPSAITPATSASPAGPEPIRKERRKEKQQEKKEQVKGNKEKESATPSSVPEQ